MARIYDQRATERVSVNLELGPGHWSCRVVFMYKRHHAHLHRAHRPCCHVHEGMPCTCSSSSACLPTHIITPTPPPNAHTCMHTYQNIMKGIAIEHTYAHLLGLHDVHVHVVPCLGLKQHLDSLHCVPKPP